MEYEFGHRSDDPDSSMVSATVVVWRTQRSHLEMVMTFNSMSITVCGALLLDQEAFKAGGGMGSPLRSKSDTKPTISTPSGIYS